MAHYIDGLENITISRYVVTENTIELWGCGAIITLLNPDDVHTVKAWIAKAERASSDTPNSKYHVCNYLEYMLQGGQYE